MNLNNKEVIVTVYNRIKLVRKSLRLTQTEFGNRLGISRDVVSNLEGNRVPPKVPFIKHLCEIFNIHEEWIYTGAGEMYDSPANSLEHLDEALSYFAILNPHFQDYVLLQINELLKLKKSNDH